MIILKNNDLAKKLKLLKAFGVDRNHGERKIPGVYDAIDLGFNYRMSEIHAAIGTVQLNRLSNFLKIRRENFVELEKNLKHVKGIKVLPQPYNDNIQSCYYCLGALLEEKSHHTVQK